jgi:two-component system chemotaxis response regulator CheY
VRVLIVDDSRAMRSMLGLIMKELGFEGIPAEHGRDALDRLHAAGPFDLALIDWNMPEMNGFELLTAIRANPVWADMRCVMVTTETEMSQVVKALEAGADEYVMKPFTRDIMRDKLATIGLPVA